MIRRVAFKKAILAGVLGAVSWEIVMRGLILLGLPMFDLVHALGTLLLGVTAPNWQWWPVGMILHASVGAIWAIFYAYFFWSFFDYPPVIQGMIFSLLPAVLAGLIMVPQLDFMNESILAGRLTKNGIFASGVGWGGPTAVILGHLVYGIVLGYLYQRPVGYAVGRQVVKYD
jgi:hypothetical protein